MNRRTSIAVRSCILLAAGCGGGTPQATTTAAETGVTSNGTVQISPRVHEPLSSPDVIVTAPDSNIVTLRAVFRTGSADDPERSEGMTYVTARVMAEGAAGELTFAEREAQLFPLAGSIEVVVDRDLTTFIGRVHTDKLAEFYPLFRDMLLSPQFAADDVDRVLNRVRAELEVDLRANDDEALGKELLQSMIFEGHPYGHPQIGTSLGLAEMSTDDVRAHYARAFCGGRLLLGVAGRVPEDFVPTAQTELFASSETCEGRLSVPPARTFAAPRILIIEKPDASSTAMSIGFSIPVTRDHADYPALALAAAYFGQHRQFAGRLMQRMRAERGLNYGDYAYVEHFDQDGYSTFPLPNVLRRVQYFSIWIRPVRPENAHFALRMALRELKLLVERGISPEDFERVRGFAGGYYRLFLQTPSRQLGFAMDDSLSRLQRSWLEALTTKWGEMTAGDVNAALQRHLSDPAPQIAIVGPNATALADAIASEAPSSVTYAAPKSEEILAEDREINAFRLGVAREAIRIMPVADAFQGTP